ncbi:5422_t:CDS:2, partial [Paraglomus occultum]
AFVDDAEPKVASIRDRATKLDEELKQLLVYYGEDPSVTKPEDFFGLIVSFASSLAKARKDNEELRRKAEKERENQVSSRMQSSRRQSDTASVSSSLAGKGELDETIQQLRAGLRRSRGRPVSRVFMEIHNEEGHQFEISYDHTRDRSSYIAHHRERSSFVGHQRERTYEVR